MAQDKTKPAITPAENGPYLVKDLEQLSNSKGEALETKAALALCRCGGSRSKPFCDGTHAKNGFSSAKLPGRVEDKREDYRGKAITIHDNRGTCAHIGHCTDGLPAVFRLRVEPWIDPTGASRDEIVATIRRCPSGALSYSLDGVEHRDQPRDPAVYVSKNGPYFVTGAVELLDSARGEGASTEHFALCRCGGSKNKPFCDGTHWYNEFKDDDS
jgi:CDGSH-type Zn-finger protein